MGNNQGDQKKKGAPAFNDMILGNLKSRSGRDTTKWLNNLSNEGEDEIVKASDVEPAGTAPEAAYGPAAFQSHLKWIDKLFDLFQQYEVEFNRVVTSPELAVNTERPSITPELVARMQGNESISFNGRMHTRYWTLIILGNLSSLEGYIIPSDHFIGFESNQSNYTQFFFLRASWSGELKWNCEGAEINQGLLPAFAKQVFGQLVKVAKGEASEEDRFQFGSTKKKAKQVDGAQPPSSFLNHGNVFDDGAFLQTNQPDEQTKTAATAQTNNQSASKSSTKQNEFPHPKPHQSIEAPVVAVSTDATKQAQPPQQTTSSSNDIVHACNVLQAAVDAKLTRLSKDGASAFEAHNFELAEKLLKKTAQVKAVREQIVQTLEQWKELLLSDSE